MLIEAMDASGILGGVFLGLADVLLLAAEKACF